MLGRDGIDTLVEQLATLHSYNTQIAALVSKASESCLVAWLATARLTHMSDTIAQVPVNLQAVCAKRQSAGEHCFSESSLELPDEAFKTLEDVFVFFTNYSVLDVHADDCFTTAKDKLLGDTKDFIDARANEFADAARGQKIAEAMNIKDVVGHMLVLRTFNLCSQSTRKWSVS